MTKKPTKKQLLLLDFIADFTAKHNYSPSYREIMHAMHLKSVSAVAEHVENCVTAGFLNKTPKSARSLEVVQPKTYDETIELFHEKIHQLAAKNPKDPNITLLKDVAKILEINL